MGCVKGSLGNRADEEKAVDSYPRDFPFTEADMNEQGVFFASRRNHIERVLIFFASLALLTFLAIWT